MKIAIYFPLRYKVILIVAVTTLIVIWFQFHFMSGAIHSTFLAERDITRNALEQRFVSQHYLLQTHQETLASLVASSGLLELLKNNRIKDISKLLNEVGYTLDVEEGINSIKLFNTDIALIGYYGQPFKNQIQTSLLNNVLKKEHPEHWIRCEADNNNKCFYVTAIPIMSDSKDIAILELTSPVNDLIFQFQQLSGIPAILISSSIVLKQNIKNITKFKNPLILTINKSSLPAESTLVVDMDTNLENQLAKKLLSNVILVGIEGLGLIIFSLFAALWNPSNRLRCITRKLPLLMEGDYAAFKKGYNYAPFGFKDEVDLLYDTSAEIAHKLNEAQKAEIELAKQTYFRQTAEILASEKSAFLNKSVQLFENERRNLANEIHDEMGQRLTMLKTYAGLIAEKTCNETDRLLAIDILDNTDILRKWVQSKLELLRPPELDTIGLNESLIQLIHQWQYLIPNLRIRYTLDPAINQMENVYRLTVYRIIQEALNNLVKYSQAKQADVEVEVEDDNLIIYISDNGIGFYPEKTKGIGLKSMRERTESLDGTFKIVSEIGKGTNITVNIPILFSTHLEPS